MKKCISCGENKEIDEYYVHSGMADGHLNKCKDCVRKYQIFRLKKNIGDKSFIIKERKRGREKYYKHKYRSYNKNGNVKYYKKFPEKYEAKCKSGSIAVPVGMNKHHWSYNAKHFKDVIFIEPSLHYIIHRYLDYDKNTKFFYFSDLLLDTREKHILCIDFIKKILKVNGIYKPLEEA